MCACREELKSVWSRLLPTRSFGDPRVCMNRCNHNLDGICLSRCDVSFLVAGIFFSKTFLRLRLVSLFMKTPLFDLALDRIVVHATWATMRPLLTRAKFVLMFGSTHAAHVFEVRCSCSLFACCFDACGWFVSWLEFVPLTRPPLHNRLCA